LDDQVRAALEIYYYRYHEILSAIGRGEGAELSRTLLGGRRLIEPMPGVAVTLALVKGWLGTRADAFYDLLRDSLPGDMPLPPPAESRKNLNRLSNVFTARPLRLAVVTSSIQYEARLVLQEVFTVIREQIAAWPVCSDLADRFASPEDVYDAVITASDSSEIRLKPHRDLYSIALHALGVTPEHFDTVVGFEDSESGTLAIRAAGIGLCVAVPFHDTAGHDLGAAGHILPGGLPQALLQHNFFLDLSP
jgi:HAD superfamily hydrolase (TIGR01509 family)